MHGHVLMVPAYWMDVYEFIIHSDIYVVTQVQLSVQILLQNTD